MGMWGLRVPRTHQPCPEHPDRVAGSAYMALMLFSGRSGISRTLVLERTASWLVVDTVFPVMRWTW